ncbi:substrate-binding domain-containing protein [Rubritalea tangerina]|uniref:Substrate-binding domain-containing protein n=1 Tax=Rubritalea tangerina TaxID=430798 RepID=A0ABW4Z5Z2_9BACT
MPKPYLNRWQQLADNMIDDLLHQSSTQLPGIQHLAQQYGLSRTSVEQALTYLENIKLIEKAQPGKRRRINQKKLKQLALQRGNAQQRVLFLTLDPHHDAAHLTLQTFRKAQSLLEADGIQLDYLTTPNSPAKLRELLTTLKPQAVLAYVIPTEFCDVIHSLAIPAAGIGISHPAISSLNSSYESLIEAAFHKAWDATHTRAVAPLWNKPDKVHARLAKHLTQTMPSTLGPFTPAYHLPQISGTTAEHYHQQLDILFQITPPSCLILGNFAQYLMASSYLLKNGLSIPQNISIILLSSDPQLKYLSPSIAHFHYSSAATTTRAIELLRDAILGASTPSLEVITQHWSPGESLPPSSDA